jgi:hypothetical protein
MKLEKKVQMLCNISKRDVELKCALDAITIGQNEVLKEVYQEAISSGSVCMLRYLLGNQSDWKLALLDVAKKESKRLCAYLTDKHKAEMDVRQQLEAALKEDKRVFDFLMPDDLKNTTTAEDVKYVINQYVGDLFYRYEEDKSIVKSFVGSLLGSDIGVAVADEIDFIDEFNQDDYRVFLKDSDWLTWALTPKISRTDDMRNLALIDATRSLLLMESMKNELGSVPDEILVEAIKSALNHNQVEIALRLIHAKPQILKDASSGLRKYLITIVVQKHPNDLQLLKIILPDHSRFPSKRLRNLAQTLPEGNHLRVHLEKCAARLKMFGRTLLN